MPESGLKYFKKTCFLKTCEHVRYCTCHAPTCFRAFDSVNKRHASFSHYRDVHRSKLINFKHYLTCFSIYAQKITTIVNVLLSIRYLLHNVLFGTLAFTYSHSIKTMTLNASVYKESTLLYKSSEIARRAANQKNAHVALLLSELLNTVSNSSIVR